MKRGMGRRAHVDRYGAGGPLAGFAA